MKRVDVVIPCYKYGKFLPDCVRSVLGQSGVDVRALIIDDASPDDSADIAAELARVDSRLELRRHADNQGYIATFNEGLDWVERDYYMVLSADDALAPGALSRAVAVMEEDREVGFTYGPQRVFEGRVPKEDGGSLAGPLVWNKITYREFLEQSWHFGALPVGAATMVVRTSLQKKLGKARYEVPMGAGLEMRLRLAYHAPVGYVHAIQGFARRHESSMTANSTPAKRFAEQFAAIKTHFAECDKPATGTGRHQEAFCRGLKLQALWEAHHAFDRGNIAHCKECLAFALAGEPRVTRERAYTRLRWKMRLGPRVYSLLRPLAKFVPR